MGTTAESLKKVTPLTELPGYEIVKELGRGTFSIVYVSTTTDTHDGHWRSFS